MKEKTIEKKLRVIKSVSQVNILSSRDNVSHIAGENSGSGSGSGSIAGSGHCFYDTLAKMGRYYHLKKPDGGYMGYSDFGSCYPGDANEKAIGPYTRTQVLDEFGNPVLDADGNAITEPNPTAHNFINNFFETKDDSWQENSETILNYVDNNYGENRGTIMAIVGGFEGSKNSHALLIESYDSVNRQYTCNDPSAHGAIVIIDAERVLFATKIMGKKVTNNE